MVGSLSVIIVAGVGLVGSVKWTLFENWKFSSISPGLGRKLRSRDLPFGSTSTREFDFLAVCPPLMPPLHRLLKLGNGIPKNLKLEEKIRKKKEIS